MGEERLAYASDLTRVFRHVVGVVLLSWQRILRLGLITGAIVLLVTEVVACLVTSSFPPPPATHLVAVALALSLGYGAAVTLLMGMLFKGGITFIRQLEGEIEIGGRAARIFAEREVGDLGAGMRRVADRRKTRVASANKANNQKPRTSPPQPGAHGMVAWAAVAAVGRDVAHARTAIPRPNLVSRPLGTQPDTRRDPDDAIMRTPAPALHALPVSASRLPRIEWAYDETSRRPAPSQPSRAPANPPAPWHDSQQTQPPSPEPETEPLPVASEQAIVIAAPTDAPVESGRTPDVPGLIPRGIYRNGNTTRPLPAVTRPLPETNGSRTPGGVRSGGLWERVSQALVGQPDAPEPQDDTPVSQPLAVSDTTPEDTRRNG